jgi:lysophospholipase L1-like esterase
MFERHPFLVGVLKPSVSKSVAGKTISHNSLGYRGPEFSVRPKPGVTRITALGGSATYCTGVDEKVTWPLLLQDDLGPEYEVINMGVPGYSTLETLIQTATLLSDLSPKVALYYLGWNDVRNMHIEGLKADYSDFHGRHQLRNLALTPVSGREDLLATTNLLRETLVEKYLPDIGDRYVLSGTANRLTDRIDSRAISIYERNLRSIVALARSQGIRPVFLPQVLNYAKLTEDRPYGWIPWVKDKDLRKAIAAYNQVMAKVALELDVEFVAQVERIKFDPEDFVDQGHFSGSGNRKFAEVVAQHLSRPPSAQSR